MDERLFTAALWMLLPLNAHSAATDVSGDQTGTWTLAGSPYLLVGDVRVPPGQSLTVEPGVEVISQGHYRITVEASLLTAVGTADQPILMTAADKVVGWRGLRLIESDDATTISHCTIELARGIGTLSEVRGGAILVVNCSPTISASMFQNNSSTNTSRNGCGGAICTEDSSAVILDNTIMDNYADSGGGIAVLDYGSPVVRGNLILDNTAPYSGGGIYCGARSSPLIESNIIVRNRSTVVWGGGGISSWTGYIFYGTFPTIRNNLIAHNIGGPAGGGLYCRYDKAVLINNTIAYNLAQRGGGIYALNHPGQVPAVTNDILWGNTAPSGAQIYLEDGSQISLTFCTVEGGWPGTGNIDADPLFLNPDGPDRIPGTDDDNLRLASGSPAIDAANTLEWPPGVWLDLDGHPRFLDDPDTRDSGLGDPPIVDMGAYEFQPLSCQADLDGDGEVNFFDMLAILAAWGPCASCPEDLDGSGHVGFQDLLIVLDQWGSSWCS